MCAYVRNRGNRARPRSRRRAAGRSTVRRKQGGNRPPSRPRPPDVSRQGFDVPAFLCRFPCALWRDLSGKGSTVRRCATSRPRSRGNRAPCRSRRNGSTGAPSICAPCRSRPPCRRTGDSSTGGKGSTVRRDLPAMSRTDGQPCANRGNRARHARDVSTETGRQPPAVASASAGRVAARVRRARVPVPLAVRPVARSIRQGFNG